MSHKKRRVPEFQAPDNHILTEKTKLIKELTEKQLNTTVCLKEYVTCCLFTNIRSRSFTTNLLLQAINKREIIHKIQRIN